MSGSLNDPEIPSKVKAMALRLYWKNGRKAAPALEQARAQLAKYPEGTKADHWRAVIELLNAAVVNGGVFHVKQSERVVTSRLTRSSEDCSVTTTNLPGQPPDKPKPGVEL